MGTFQRDESAGTEQPGAASQPEDLTGDGPVTLEDRTEPGGQGSPDTNQATTEPMSPTPDHPEPMAAPDLDSMNVGATDPQSPQHPGAQRREPSATGAPSERAGTGPAEGVAHRAPGRQGRTPQGESVETDVSAGAARMGAQPLDSAPGRSPGQGDAQNVPSSGSSPSPGTSEEHHIVRGTRLPEAGET